MNPTVNWPHQDDEKQYALEPARAFYWDPRTGKTREARIHIDELIEHRGVTRILVIAPKLVCSEVWEEELSGLDVYGLYEHKLETRVQIIKSLTEQRPHWPVVILINWDVIAKKEVLDALLAWKAELVIADELHYAKSAGAARSRALQRLGRVARFRRGLTGTPTPRDYIDLFAQYKFLDPAIFGTSKAKFISRYIELDYWGRPKRYYHLPELRAKMFSIASRVDRRQIWKDRPPLEVVRKLTLPSRARSLYDNLVDNAVAEFEGLGLDATHRLTEILRCQQLSAGFVSDGESVKWVHTTKIEAALVEIKDLLASDQKVVVFYHFTPEGLRYEEAIRSDFGKIVGRIGGKVSLSAKQRISRDFQNPESEMRVLVMQDSMGIGIPLSASSYIIRPSVPIDYDKFVQSNDRIYKPNTVLTNIYLEARNTVDQWARDLSLKKEKASDRLMNKQSFEAALRGN